MKLKPVHKIIIAAVVCLALAVGGWLSMHKDMTGVPYSEIEAYIAAHPKKIVRYTVTIGEGEAAIQLTNEDISAVITTPMHIDSMTAQAEYLQHLTEIRLEGMTPTPAQIVALRAAFPAANVRFAPVEFLGQTIAADTTVLDFSALTADKLEEAAQYLQLPLQPESVVLSKNGAVSPLTIEEAARLQAARPEVHLEYTTELFGQLISTDMDTVEYFRVPIGNEGLDTFRTLMPMMYNLTYLKLDTCEIDNELLAEFRTEVKDKCKVVWRVFFGQNNALTDTYKIWATWNVDTKEVAVLQYCNEVKYLDLGHNSFMNLDFMKEMTELEMAIVAIGNLHDISGIVNCTKLEFLEIFSNRTLDDADMQHLSALTNMKYLNISNTILMRDLSFTDSMPKLKKLWNTLNRVPTAEIERVKALHPDCEFVFLYDGDPTDYGWRYVYKDGEMQMTPEYALVRARFGYDAWDFSRDEKGYLREEITYESLGLTPT